MTTDAIISVKGLTKRFADGKVVALNGVDVREVMLFDAPGGWVEWSPFPEYGAEEASRWLRCALELGWGEPPAPLADSVEVNATIPAVDVSADGEVVAKLLERYPGCTTVKVKVAEAGQTLDDDVQRITVLAAEPTVLSSIIDPASVEQYDQSFNPINQISVDDVATFLSEATDSHRMEAINGGLLARAEAQAEALLTNQVGATIRGTDLEEYEIAFQWKRNQ